MAVIKQGFSGNTAGGLMAVAAAALLLGGCSGRDTDMAEKVAAVNAAADRAEQAATRAEAAAKKADRSSNAHPAEPAEDSGHDQAQNDADGPQDPHPETH